MNRHSLAAFAVLLSSLMLASPAAAADGKDDGAARLYFVRHSETIGNATGNYSGDNLKNFSEKGLKLVEELTPVLKQYTYDRIIVSPWDRAVNTVLPYLKDTNRKAEAMPIMGECCTQGTKDNTMPTSGTLGRAFKVELPAATLEWLTFADEDAKWFVNSDTYQKGLWQVMKAKELIDADLAKPGRHLLVVGHSQHGGRMFELMTTGKFSSTIHIENAKMNILRYDGDGKYTLEMLNGKPVK